MHIYGQILEFRILLNDKDRRPQLLPCSCIRKEGSSATGIGRARVIYLKAKKKRVHDQ